MREVIVGDGILDVPSSFAFASSATMTSLSSCRLIFVFFTDGILLISDSFLFWYSVNAAKYSRLVEPRQYGFCIFFARRLHGLPVDTADGDMITYSA